LTALGQMTVCGYSHKALVTGRAVDTAPGASSFNRSPGGRRSVRLVHHL
jgi:hypothetical protein